MLKVFSLPSFWLSPLRHLFAWKISYHTPRIKYQSVSNCLLKLNDMKCIRASFCKSKTVSHFRNKCFISGRISASFRQQPCLIESHKSTFESFYHAREAFQRMSQLNVCSVPIIDVGGTIITTEKQLSFVL